MGKKNDCFLISLVGDQRRQNNQKSQIFNPKSAQRNNKPQTTKQQTTNNLTSNPKSLPSNILTAPDHAHVRPKDDNGQCVLSLAKIL
jgi:hypothetical protein